MTEMKIWKGRKTLKQSYSKDEDGGEKKKGAGRMGTRKVH